MPIYYLERRNEGTSEPMEGTPSIGQGHGALDQLLLYFILLVSLMSAFGSHRYWRGWSRQTSDGCASNLWKDKMS